MTTRPGAAILVCFAIGLLAPAAARAQSADLVLCDRIAADPADPDKPADVKGVAAIDRADIATAIKYCGVAAAKSRRAQYQLGRALAANRQMPDAIAAWRKAADRGSAAAMVELGALSASGSGGPKDEAQAGQWFERAAAAGHPRAVAMLGAVRPGGGPADPAATRDLLAKTAETNAEAQFQLGVMAAEGDGGPKNDAAARAWFEKAAAQGHAGALLWIGSFAESGRGGPQDKRAAKAYYEKAAALGSEDAKAALKRMDCPYAIKDKRGNVVTNLCF